MKHKVIVVCLSVILAVTMSTLVFGSSTKDFYFNGKYATAELYSNAYSAGAATYTGYSGCSLRATISGSYIQINPSGEIEVKTVQNYGGAYGHTAAAEVGIPYGAPVDTQFFMTESSHHATDGVGSGSCSLTETYP